MFSIISLLPFLILPFLVSSIALPTSNEPRISTLSVATISQLHAIVDSIQPGPDLDYSDSKYAILVDAILNKGYTRNSPVPGTAPPITFPSNNTTFAVFKPLFGGLACETSASSPTYEQAKALVKVMQATWSRGIKSCDQSNRFQPPLGSGCTNLAKLDGASIGICGDYLPKWTVNCATLLPIFDDMAWECEQNGRVGGYREVWPKGVIYGKPYNKLIMH
ncbi:hypothetical protein BJ508DRAFT_315527 [Ascobolus immersus RN42]|uniref:Uncharacterized protein n=1 Tax=Ascobolus immersus RN42 TaxID=1160509 RepID=A0A3N4HCZ1_ASCIM|nr:hypothetical protein BJ508DRAFT_315527 [Ascobolus immersus RN42]